MDLMFQLGTTCYPRYGIDGPMVIAYAIMNLRAKSFDQWIMQVTNPTKKCMSFSLTFPL